MAIVKKVVGQITLKVLIDVSSITYYYLLLPSAAPVPTKPTVSPPPTITTEGYSGWSETEPGYTSGDTRSLYVTVRTIYSDGSFAYTTPSLSSSYEAAKEAYNRAQSALSLAGETRQYFWDISTAIDSDIPAGAYVTSVPSSTFERTKSGGNIIIQSTGLTIRDGITQLASLTGNALNFYNPQAQSGQNSLVLSIGANGTLQSGNYSRGSDSKFASNGTKIDLVKGDIITKYFRLSQGLENLNAGAYIHGTIEALDGSIGSDSTNYWEIGNSTDYNLHDTAKIIGHGSSFIQLGDDNTWRLATNRIHTGWYTTTDSLLHYPSIDSKYWDFGIHTPTAATDKFLYIRKAKDGATLTTLLYDIDDTYTTSQWDYQFWIDGSGNVHAPGFYIGNSTTPIGGGAGTTAQKIINSDNTYGKGSNTKPIYIDSNGYVQESGYTINKSVPSDAKFTDHITSATTSGTGNAVTSITSDSNGNLTVKKDITFLTSYTETDPTVPAWAKATNKPSYSYSEITGTVPQSALPSYVDDVVEYNGKSSFPTTGEAGKIYVDTSTNLTWRWSGTTYVEISPSLALGETSSTAYRGDRGAAAYAHAVTNKGSAFTSGLYKITTNSEGHVTAAVAAGKSDIGLGNVDNKSSATIRGELTSSNVTDALGFTPYDSSNPDGYTTNKGTVTSVRVQASSPLQSSTSTAQSTSLNTTISFSNQNKNLVLAGPSTGSAAAPTFRSLVADDIPGLAWSKITSGKPTTLSGYGITDAADKTAITGVSISNAQLTVTRANGTSTTTDVTITASQATGATKLIDGEGEDVAAGSATLPVYFSGGYPQAVTSIAKLNGTATTYPQFYAPTSAGTQGYVLVANASGVPAWTPQSDITSGNTDSYHTGSGWSGLTYSLTGVGNASNISITIPTGTSSTTVLRGDHTYTTSIAKDTTSTNQLTLAYGTKYKITAGGTSYVFTMPASDNTNTTYSFASGDSNGQIKVTPSSGDAYNVDVKGLGAAAYKGVTDNSTATAVTSTDTNLITARTLYNAGYVKSSGVTSVATGTGLTGGTITTTGTISLATITKSNTTSTASPSHGGTVTMIDSVTYDNYGRVTGVNTKTVTLPADSNTDTKVTQAYSTTSNTYPLLMTATAGISSISSRGDNTAILNNSIYGNPSTGLINSLIYQVSAKAQMKYDSSLEAIVFSFV